MLTVGQLNEKISVLKSKIAVTEGIVLYLKTHYMPSDGGEAEMHFTRSDYGKVPPRHTEATIADYVEYLDAIKIELEALENTPLSMPETAKLVAVQDALEEKPDAPKPKPAVQTVSAPKPTPRKETPSEATRGNQDRAPAVQPNPSRQVG